jgi:S1-C subfamily serine protease
MVIPSLRALSIAPLSIALLLLSAQAKAQEYQSFRTNDEANNIEVFKGTNPPVVYITNSRYVRQSFFNLNPQEVPQGRDSGFVCDKQGYVVTNFHVIQNALRVTETLQDGS